MGQREGESSISAQKAKFPIIVTYFTVMYYSSWGKIKCEGLLPILFLEKQVTQLEDPSP